MGWLIFCAMALVVAGLLWRFGRLPKGPKPAPLTTIEPKQSAERMVILREKTQPFYAEVYHRPDSRQHAAAAARRHSRRDRAAQDHPGQR